MHSLCLSLHCQPSGHRDSIHSRSLSSHLIIPYNHGCQSITQFCECINFDVLLTPTMSKKISEAIWNFGIHERECFPGVPCQVTKNILPSKKNCPEGDIRILSIDPLSPKLEWDKRNWDIKNCSLTPPSLWQ